MNDTHLAALLLGGVVAAWVAWKVADERVARADYVGTKSRVRQLRQTWRTKLFATAFPILVLASILVYAARSTR